MKRVFVVGLAFATVFCSAAVSRGSPAANPDFYASPEGSGNGRSEATPFTIVKFWSVARPGVTLWLLDGRYRGESSMIAPPVMVKGAPGNPIRIRALHEGRVLIDGEGKLRPVYLSKNEFVSIEGINACCSKYDVVYLSATKGVSIRRVVGWNAAPDQNAMIFSIAYGENTLLEDTAGFGPARKTYQYFLTDGPATIRRAWGEWNWSLNKGPKMTFSLVYNSRNLTVENAIGTWRSLMPSRYIIMNDGKAYIAGVWSEYNHSKSSCGPGVTQPDGTCLVSDGKIDQMYGVLTADAFSRGQPDRRANSRYLGSLAYVLPGVDTVALPRLVFVTQVEKVSLENVVTSWPVSPSDKEAVLLGNCTARLPEAPCSSERGLVAKNVTSFGGRIRFPGLPASQWQISGLVETVSPEALYGSSGASIFQAGARGGASLCYQYRDGVLTGTPLWPWPMDERIKEAMILAGREPVDVTKTIESLFGPIPAACRSDATPAPAHSAAAPAKSNPRAAIRTGSRAAADPSETGRATAGPGGSSPCSTGPGRSV